MSNRRLREGSRSRSTSSRAPATHSQRAFHRHGRSDTATQPTTCRCAKCAQPLPENCFRVSQPRRAYRIYLARNKDDYESANMQLPVQPNLVFSNIYGAYGDFCCDCVLWLSVTLAVKMSRMQETMNSIAHEMERDRSNHSLDAYAIMFPELQLEVYGMKLQHMSVIRAQIHGLQTLAA